MLADGTLGPTSAVGTLAGGTGGTFKEAKCASGSVVYNLGVNYGTVANQVLVRCKTWNPSARTFGGTGAFSGELGAQRAQDPNISLTCSSNTQPGAGIRGRSGWIVDAIGLTCDEP